MHPMLNIAVRAARGAGNIIARACGQLDMVQSIQKGTNDFVTNVDKEAEQAIVNILRKSYPDHDIVAEEGGEYTNNNSDYQWVIDPLDGTTNFIKGIPHFAWRPAEWSPYPCHFDARFRRYCACDRLPV